MQAGDVIDRDHQSNKRSRIDDRVGAVACGSLPDYRSYRRAARRDPEDQRKHSKDQVDPYEKAKPGSDLMVDNPEDQKNQADDAVERRRPSHVAVVPLTPARRLNRALGEEQRHEDEA